MQRREQILLGGLLAAVVIWQTSSWITSFVFGPFEERSLQLNNLKKTVSEKTDKMLELARAEKALKELKAKSLPPDDPGKDKKPTALDSGRSYLKWLEDLAHLCGFESLRVTPGGQTPKDNVYISVVVKIEAEARFDQLARFLDLFYRTQLVHRISTMNVSTKISEGDPTLKVHLDVEGLVLLDAPPRRSLFPEAYLTDRLSEDATTLLVEETEGFPKDAGFRIRIKSEFLKVIAVDGKKWTVERGVEQTVPASYSDETQVELVRLDPNHLDRTIDEFRQLIASNVFVKPPPPLKLKLAGLAEKTFTRGKPIEFVITASSFDTLLGKPQFAAIGNLPPGLKLDRSGKVTWKPGDDMKAGKYVIDFEVRHPSAENGHLTESVTINLRDPKPAPKLSAARPPKVYLNREWKYRPELTLAESDAANLTWKLGDRSPQGLKIDSKSGELTWTPGDAVPIGETTVPLILTDSDTPPQSTNLSLKLDVQDDAAQFTRLTTILVIGDKKRAFLYDQSTQKNTELHEGDPFAISELSGTVKQIGKKHVVMTLGQKELRLDVGESLREAQTKTKD